jgi:hypothetical protein
VRWQRLCGFTPLDAPTALAACCGFDLCHKYILYLYLYLYLDEISRKRAQGTRSAAALELLRTLNSPRAGSDPPSVACFTLTAAVTADGTPVGMVDVLELEAESLTMHVSSTRHGKRRRRAAAAGAAVTAVCFEILC